MWCSVMEWTMEQGKMYSVKGYDSFSGEHYDIGKYKDKDKAINKAKESGGEMNLIYVYDERGVQIAKFGTFWQW